MPAQENSPLGNHCTHKSVASFELLAGVLPRDRSDDKSCQVICNTDDDRRLPKQLLGLKNPFTTYPVVLVLRKVYPELYNRELKLHDSVTTLVAQPQRPPRPRVALRAERRDRRRARPI